MGAKEALGTALYSSGYFERALVEFHRVSRLRQSTLYEDWITRCEETIKAFLAAANVEIETVTGIPRKPLKFSLIFFLLSLYIFLKYNYNRFN